jgi:uncharacterized protein
MTPQEQQLVDDLFDRLAKLEAAPRDPAAERLIADGARRAPHAVYALVQTTLVQDEALKRANARIEELQAQFGGAGQPQQQQGGFLDSMREAVFGRPRETSGSVPSVRPQGTQTAFAAAPGQQPEAGYPPQRPAPGYPLQPPYPAAPAFGAGGSFLGTAASTAAGVIGGALLLDGIRSMFGHHSGLGGFVDQTSPWGGGDPAREAGIDTSGDHVGQGVGDAGSQIADSGGGFTDAFADDSDFGGDGGGDTYDA